MALASSLQSYGLVAVGGAIGSIARFAMVNALSANLFDRATLATMAVNIIGSTLIGLITVLASERPYLQHFFIVGILGGFTTFSSFSQQSFRLIQEQRWGFAAAVILGSVALCLLGTSIGALLGRQVMPPPSLDG